VKISRLTFDTEKSEDLERKHFAQDVEAGLSSHPKNISSKYFYDDYGSQIFQKITKLDEYYPTRTEFKILESLKDSLPDIIGSGEIDLVELGAGDGHKTKILIDSFLQKGIKVNFMPIDISEEALHLLEENIGPKNNLSLHGIVADYIEGLSFARKQSENKMIILFLGSNIGNFSREESLHLLRQVRKHLRDKDYLLIGFDLKKDIDQLTRAYSDSEGVTAQFNLNLLKRINSELGGTFNIEQFKHQAFYNPELGAMESYLISLTEQDVFIAALNRTFHFEAFEPIHLEYSFKFLEKEINEISEVGGFKSISNFKDPDSLFIDALWQV